jgi:hypothetical protein
MILSPGTNKVLGFPFTTFAYAALVVAACAAGGDHFLAIRGNSWDGADYTRL